MQRYDAYKESGVEWIGEIPDGWEISRFKALFTERDERAFDAVPEELLSVSENYGIDYRRNRIGSADTLVRAETLNGYKRCYPGDLVMNIMLAWKGAQAVSMHQGVVSPSYAVYQSISTDVCSRYFHYLLRTDLYKERFKRYSTGIIDSRLRLYPDVFLGMDTILPPKPDQRAIADYLDNKTTEIDALVEDCEREIELLQEYRKAVISEAVTKGLDPTVPMKDSGIDWIGEIPHGWRAEKLKFHMILINGRAYKQEELLDSGKYRVLRVGNFNTNASWYYSDMELDEKQYCQSGDLLYLWATTFGPRIWYGEKAIFHYHIWKVQLGEQLDKRYTYYVLYSQASWQELQSHGSTMVHVTKANMEESLIPIPPLGEQIAIAEFLDAKTSEVDELIADKRTMVDKLHEYRKSLISEAVTGKFKVPGV